ncbi:MAG: acyltransferase [Coriobacteriales bacterium]|jgi:peptidoglycan/LPS O-acetylase OafA/YrhL|nr:acyltransferase [Coriobacteriales bacterium]
MAQHVAAHNQGTAGRLAKKPLTHYAWLSLLRAYGVLLVLVYHFFPWLMPGGFIGVDIFLVFSGYLITSLLVSEFKKEGKIDVLAFYKRRYRRLFPALVALVLVVMTLSLTIPADFRADIVRQVAAVLSWTSNFYEIEIGRSYADTLLPHLFVHTWTLSVEMHYYLIWGLLLTLIMPLFIKTAADGRKSIVRSRKVIAVLAGVLALGSFIAMQLLLMGAEDPSSAYYSTLSHAYPVLIGSVTGALAGFGYNRLIALFERLKPKRAIILVSLSVAGIAAMAIFIPFENRFMFHAGILLTALLVSLIILIGRGAQETLQHRPEPKLLMYIADRSYSIYLFHWPLMIIVLEWARSLFGRVLVGVNFAYITVALIALALTFLAAHLSYRFVERPFSRRRRPQGEKLAHKHGDSTRGHAAENSPSDSRNKPRVPAKRLLGAVLGAVLAVFSIVALSTAPLRTSIELNYQTGLLELDLKQMNNAHLTLLHTGEGGNRGGEPQLLVTPGSITIVGDSVTIFPAEDLTRLTDAVVDAEVSRAMVNGIRILQELQESRSLGEYVVVALATNAHADSFDSAVTICENLAPGHKMIFVTAYGNESMEELNAQLRTLPDTYPFVTIADWAAAISGQEHLLAADGYHLNGQEAIDIYVNVILNALEEAKHKPAR